MEDLDTLSLSESNKDHDKTTDLSECAQMSREKSANHEKETTPSIQMKPRRPLSSLRTDMIAKCELACRAALTPHAEESFSVGNYTFTLPRIEWSEVWRNEFSIALHKIIGACRADAKIWSRVMSLHEGAIHKALGFYREQLEMWKNADKSMDSTPYTDEERQRALALRSRMIHLNELWIRVFEHLSSIQNSEAGRIGVFEDVHAWIAEYQKRVWAANDAERGHVAQEAYRGVSEVQNRCALNENGESVSPYIVSYKTSEGLEAMQRAYNVISSLTDEEFSESTAWICRTLQTRCALICDQIGRENRRIWGSKMIQREPLDKRTPLPKNCSHIHRIWSCSLMVSALDPNDLFMYFTENQARPPQHCITCHRTPTECGVPTFSVCKNCRAFSYCSAACQRADWKYRHKQECRGLAKFLRAV